MALPVRTDTANNGTGATGFSSLNRGISPSQPVSSFTSLSPVGGEARFLPSRGIIIQGRELSPREPTGLGRSTGVLAPPVESSRGVSNRDPIGQRPTSGDVIVSRDIPFSSGVGGRSNGRVLAPSPLPSPATDTNVGTNQTPLDYNIDKLFRGYFNEPIRGSADKSGEFVYVPPITSGGGNSGMLLLAIAGIGIIGYFAYKKFAKGE